MVKNIAPEKAICTKCRVVTICLLLVASFLSNPKKSTQNEVVNAVKAESVVAKVAAVKHNTAVVRKTRETTLIKRKTT